MLIVGALGYIELFMTRPIGRGPAGPAVKRAPFDRIWSEKPVVLFGVGDSITAGLGADSIDRSYFNRLKENSDGEFPELRGVCLSAVFPNLTTENVAMSGSTSLMHLEVLLARLPTHDTETSGIVVITTGGNDLIHNYGRSAPKEGAMYGATTAQAAPWVAGFRIRLDAMLDLINERFPGGCHVFLADIYDPTGGIGDAPSVFLPDWPDGLTILRQYNQIIHDACQKRDNVHLVPLHKTFLGHGAHCRQFWRQTYRSHDPHYWFYSNIEDPNDRGYDAIRRVFLNSIVEGWRKS
jgi:lysophospholipase L1-like esterase